MHKISLRRLAHENLLLWKQYSYQYYEQVMRALQDLENNGFKASSMKRLTSSSAIFRKRAGRVRILFTFADEVFHIWIIDLEKDPKKDYARWIRYVVQHA